MAETTPAPVPASQDAENPGIPQPRRTRPNKPIPTERIKLERQFDLLRAFAGCYVASMKPVTNKDVAEVVQMSETTTSLANGWFTETGLLTKAASGGWIPADEVLSYHRAYEWDKDSAARELQPVLSKTWFWEVLQPKLGFRPMEEKDAINALGSTSAASADFRINLKLIIDYLVTAQMVERDGAQIRLLRNGAAGQLPEKRDQGSAPHERGAQATSAITTGFVQRPGGGVQFSINIDVSMTEFAGWTPDRISAFFNGMAKVLAAKSGIEQEVAE
jgi:hypothetical protein